MRRNENKNYKTEKIHFDTSEASESGYRNEKKLDTKNPPNILLKLLIAPFKF